MARACLLLVAAWMPLQSAFHAVLPRGATSSARASAVNMGSAEVVEKKAKVVSEIVDHMEDAMLMWCVRTESIKVNDMNMMRQKFPEGVTVRCVKNTLVRRAAEEVPRFQGGDSLLVRSNYWFFVPEEHVRATYDTWNDWVKETKNEDTEIVGGMYEGECLDNKGIEAITKLPTKQELMGQTASLLKAMPTKLARLLNQAGAQRLARVTKQASGQKLVQAIKAVESKMDS